MAFYFFVILYVLTVYIFMSNFFPKKRKTLLLFTMGVLFIISALRNYTIGNDTYEYIRLYEIVKNTEFSNLMPIVKRYEIGYVFLNKIISVFFDNPYAILVFSSIFIYIGYSRFILKFSKNVGLSVVLFILMGYFAQTLNIIRFQLALVILLLAFEKIVESKKIQFICLVLVAFLFHKTAIVFLVVLPLKKLGINRKNLIFISGGTIFIYLMFSNLMSYFTKIFNYYIDYSNTAYLDGEIRIASVIYLILTLFILIFIFLVRKLNKVNNEKIPFEENFMLLLLFIGACILVISFKFNLLDRVSDYFKVYSIVLLPNSLQYLNNKYKKLLYSMSCVVLFFLYFSFIHLSRPEWNNIFPYETWIKESENY